MRRAPWLFLLLAAALRLFGCLRTPVPGRDGASYLWMAQQFAAGDERALFATVFHPLYPLLVGGLMRLWPGLDPVAAGQLMAAGCAALAVLPLWWLTARLFGSAAANWAAAMYSIGTWFVRHPAECMSEGPFYLLAALWAWALLRERPRPALAGAAAGIAFLARPEGLAMAATGGLVLLLRRRWRGALLHAAAALLLAALLPLGFALAGHGFMLTPKASFNWQVGAGGADSAWQYYLGQWLRLPGDACEGLGFLVLPLMLAGALRWRPRRLGKAWLLLLGPFALQCAVVPLLKSHHRFVSGFGVLLLPFAGAMFALLRRWLRRRRWWWAWAPVLLLFASEARLWLDTPVDRTIERDLGRALGERLRYGETLASDMPRLYFFAGRQPPPPRPIGGFEILQQALAPDCRFVALKVGRTDLDPAILAELGLEPEPLPVLLSAHPGRGAVLLFARRTRR